MEELVDQFITALETERHVSKNTTSAYRADLRQAVAYLSSPPDEDQVPAIVSWSELTGEHLQAYLLNMRTRDYAPSTIARKTAALKSFTSWMKEQGQVGDGLGKYLVAPRVERSIPRAMSSDETARLLGAPLVEQPVRADRLRDAAMFSLLYGTGMRVTELVSLDVKDVDFETGQVTCQGKSGRSRVVSVAPQTLDLVRRYLADARPQLAGPGNSSLFVNHRGGRLTRQGFWLILKSYADGVGISDITPHTLRHTYATDAVRGGAELADVQRQLGHVNISTMQVYRQLAASRNSVTAIGEGTGEA